MPRLGHPVHQVLLDAFELGEGQSLVELGCGDGETLLLAGAASATAILIGIEADPRRLAAAANRLEGSNATWQLVRANLDCAIPLMDGSVDGVLSHNVLEYLEHPARLVADTARVLRPGGRAVWSHIDFAGLILNAPDAVLNRRVLEAHATFVPRWMRCADGYMGRRLPGLVRSSPLVVDSVEVLLITSTRLDGDARWRIDQIVAVVRPAAEREEIDLSPIEIEDWIAGLESADAAGDFFFAEPTVVVSSSKPRSH